VDGLSARVFKRFLTRTGSHAASGTLFQLAASPETRVCLFRDRAGALQSIRLRPDRSGRCTSEDYQMRTIGWPALLFVGALLLTGDAPSVDEDRSKAASGRADTSAEQSRSNSQVNRTTPASETLHWAFRTFTVPPVPDVNRDEPMRTPIDHFIESALEQHSLALGKETDRAALIRRLSYDLLGLPPTPEEVAAFVVDPSPDAYSKQVQRYLASPRYGERWGKYWLDVVGYADSNGYFNADTDRPLAYKYRDYVIRSFNADVPYDRFVREQLAGDELFGGVHGDSVTPRTIELLTATHFLRNAQDGTGESDGNADEVTVDRATVINGTLQITMNALLGLTIQCARCHEHKFEPIAHEEYYRLQAVFYPAFPAFHAAKWVKPQQRVTYAATAGELTDWKARTHKLNADLAALNQEYADWVKKHRPPGLIRFRDSFDSPAAKLIKEWTNTVPGDDTPAGKIAVNIDSVQPPGAIVKNGELQIIESGAGGDRWLSTRRTFDWTPAREGEWIQATFGLVSDRVQQSAPAARIAYGIALHDFNDNSPVKAGNILLDGNPAGGAAVYVDYPGQDSKNVGVIGSSGYKPQRNYGVRVTNVGGGKFRLEQLADGLPEKKSVMLSAQNLPDGTFGFEYCCGRSFIVDTLIVESMAAETDHLAEASRRKEFLKQYKSRRQQLDVQLKALNEQRINKPGKLAWVTDLFATAPQVYRLERGIYNSPAEKVEPSGLQVLTDTGAEYRLEPPSSGSQTTGRRLAFARWLTRPGARPAALLARVMANRIWQHHFGTALISTPDNLGHSGAAPSHPELLEYLAAQFVGSGWSIKSLHRLIVISAVYRQSSSLRKRPYDVDPDNRLLWRYPARRLDAEAVRDAMLSLAGRLDQSLYGRYVPTSRRKDGNVVVDKQHEGSGRRSIYLRQRRTQVHTLLGLFDAPSMVENCSERNTSTVPLQSLALLNSEFVRFWAADFARRLERAAAADETSRINRAFLLVASRRPDQQEQEASQRFLDRQRQVYEDQRDGSERVWNDFCQMLLASSIFLYVD